MALTTQLCGDYFINSFLRIPEPEPSSIQWNVVFFFLVAQLMLQTSG